MWTWVKARWGIVRDTIQAGDVGAFEQRYLPAAVFAGMIIGAVLSLLSSLLGVVIVLAAGFALGYAARAYVSYRRRLEFRRQRNDFV